MFSSIERKPVDRFPFCTYNCHGLPWGSHGADPGYRPILDQIDATSAGVLFKMRAEKRENPLEFTVSERREGSETYTTTTWHTPRGPLTRTMRKPSDQPDFCVKHYVENREDLDRVLSVPYRSADWGSDEIGRRAGEIGERGLIYLMYRDPFYEASELFDQQEFAITTHSDFPLVQSLVEVCFERIYRDLERLLEGLVKYPYKLLLGTGGPERATPPLFSPDVFRELVTPFQKRLVRLIHKFGYPACLHCHGRVKEVLPHILACGFDALEPIEPTPQGNIDLPELMREADGALTLIGHMQDQEFYTATEDRIRERVRRNAFASGHGSGYICCPSCTPFQHPPTATYVRNYIAFLDESARCG